jgi:ATP-dependent exoDNAse (exonuclease V) beta subunit
VPRALVDAEARRSIAERLDATLIVEAAAGTGKTTELVGRIVAVLRDTKDPARDTLDRVVSVTFTEKAAGEMKLRLRSGIEKARIDPATTPAQRERLDRALAHLEVARIGTIHSLCSDLLRERPVEAGVDPLFEVCAEDEAERLFDQAFEGWFQEALRDPPEGVRRVLRRRRGSDRGGPREALREAAWKLVGHRDFDAAWKKPPRFDRRAAMDHVLAELRAVAPLAARAERKGDFLAQNLEHIGRFLADLDRKSLVRGRDDDGLEAELAEMARWRDWKWKGGGYSYARGLLRADVLALRDGAKATLDALLESESADLAACLHEELRPPAARYLALKTRAGKLDFLDLLLSARDLVAKSHEVRRELQARFDRIFVDEFQDTDPLQAEILLLLAADDAAVTDWTLARPVPGKLFLVGDPKQSIYRFRRADVALYETVKERLLGQGAELLYLTTSFRGAPAIQDAVNAAFSVAMTGTHKNRPSTTSTQARYVALEHYRDEVVEQPAIVALSVPRPYSEWGKVTAYAVQRSLPDTVGAFVDWLIHESGWTVSERGAGPDGQRVPLEARHICLLFKRFQSYGDDLTRSYVRALEARRVPHVLVGGRSFHDREEVQAVVRALTSIEWPDDELSVYATLRGPFFALSDEALLSYRAATGDGEHLGLLHPLRAGEEAFLARETDETREVTAALTVLRELHVERNRRPIADSVARLLEATRAHAGIAIWPTGEQALANVLRVMDHARRFEANGATSFRAFVERLESEAISGQAGEAPVVEEGTEGVRIMTVHRAKGLEFPVVILADPTAPATFTTPTRHVDQAARLWAEPLAGCMPVELLEQREDVLRRDDEENVRLAYVAATRARDLLVIPAVGDGPLEGWLDVLHPALYPEPNRKRNADVAAGCPRFGKDSVLERPLRAEREPRDSVMPGSHAPRAGKHRVVWWDPFVLRLDKQAEGGLRQQRILQADESGVVSEKGVVDHREWKRDRDETLRKGSLPTLPVVTATAVAEGQLVGFEGVPRAPVGVERTGTSRVDRPRGKRFGTLVHAILAEVDLDADGGAVALVAAAQGRVVGATTAEIDAGITAANAALLHPIMRRAAASMKRGECRREAPILLPLADGTVIEGVIDLAFREPSGAGVGSEWTVVDFKTDVELSERKDKYETQILLYVKAIVAATGEPASAVLLSV